MGTATRIYLVVGSLLIVGHFTVLQGGVLYEVTGFGAAAAIFTGIVVHRPRARRAWALIGASQLLFALGDVVYYNITTAFPSPGDGLYLTGTALLVWGVGALIVGDMGARDAGGHLDALLVTSTVGVATFALLLADSFSFHHPFADTVAIAYPVGDLLVFALLMRMAFAAGSRAPSYWLLLLAFLAMFVTDISYALPNATYSASVWLDIGWMGSYVGFGAVGLHPSMRRLMIPRTERVLLPLRRVALLGLAALLLPFTAFGELWLYGNVDVVPLAVTSSVILVAMFGRIALLVREVERMRLRAEHSERKFRLVFERSPIGISIGEDGMMKQTNPALHRMLGYTAEELSHKHYLDVTHPDDASISIDIEKEHDRGPLAMDKRYVGKDGRVVDTHVNLVIDPDESFGMSLVEDVTERRRLERQLHQAQKMEAVGKLAGGIAHDFNNLMTAVLGYSDLLLRDVPPEGKTSERVEAIRDAAVRASALTHQLLAYSRQQVLAPVEVDLCDVVARMQSLLTKMIGNDIQLEAVLQREPVVVRADPSQLEQVVMNLVVNARDAMPDGGRLTIAVRAEDDEAVLTVSDTGLGMDETVRAQIFEPFFTTKPLAESYGLGLSTVHGIVGQSGGTIEVDSVVGEGTVFTVRLPLLAVVLPGAARVATLVD